MYTINLFVYRSADFLSLSRSKWYVLHSYNIGNIGIYRNTYMLMLSIHILLRFICYSADVRKLLCRALGRMPFV